LREKKVIEQKVFFQGLHVSTPSSHHQAI